MSTAGVDDAIVVVENVERIMRDGIDDGQIVRQDIHVAATSLMGAIVETLLGPLSEPPHPAQEDDLIKGLVQFCVHALGPVPSIPASTKAVP
jgi:hypothetical protein